jgi:polysaccharide biosynthesis/export protein
MPRRSIARAGVLAAVALTAGCVRPPAMTPYIVTFPPPPPAPSQGAPLPNALDLLSRGEEGAPAKRPAYRIGPLDRISVRVWGRPELGSQTPVSADLRVSVVDQDGSIHLPFLAPIHVGGSTIAEINAAVAEGYARVVESPQVETYLESCWSQVVAINGEVHQPGTQHLCDTLMTVAELLHAAGGANPEGDIAHCVLSRNGARYALDLRGANRGESRAAEINLLAGDNLYVPGAEERQVFVFGEVVRPGAYPIPGKGMTFVEALGLAGGYNPSTAKINEVYLARMTAGIPVIYRMTLSELLQGPEVELTAGDRILLPPRPITQWNRWIRQLFPLTVDPLRSATQGSF